MSATWRAIARKDLEDAVRSKLVWGLTAVFVFFLTLLLLSFKTQVPDGVEVEPTRPLAFIASLSQLFVPLVALVVGYMAVVGERRSGSLRILLSYPFTRGDVVLGKLVGRSLVIAATLLVAFLVGGGVATAVYSAPGAGTFGEFVAAAVLFGLSFTGLAVGVSAATATRSRAMAAAIGSYVVFLFFWRPLVGGLYWVVYGSLPGLQAEPWYFFLKRATPIRAFRTLEESILGETVRPVVDVTVEDLPPGTSRAELELADRVAGDLPVYLEDWFAVPVLLAWGLVPVLVGYLRFRSTDLG